MNIGPGITIGGGISFGPSYPSIYFTNFRRAVYDANTGGFTKGEVITTASEDEFVIFELGWTNWRYTTNSSIRLSGANIMLEDFYIITDQSSYIAGNAQPYGPQEASYPFWNDSIFDQDPGTQFGIIKILADNITEGNETLTWSWSLNDGAIYANSTITITDSSRGQEGSILFNGANNYLIANNEFFNYLAFSPDWWNNSATYFDYNTDPPTEIFDSNFYSGYTVECWIKYSGTPLGFGYPIIGNMEPVNPVGKNYWSLGINSDSKLEFYYWTGVENRVISSNVVTSNQWHHVAMTQANNIINLFVDGTKVANTAVSGTPQTTITQQDFNVRIAIGSVGSNYFNGKISNIRVAKDARYGTSNFTAPTGHLTYVANTYFLLQTRGVINPDPPEANTFLTNLIWSGYTPGYPSSIRLITNSIPGAVFDADNPFTAPEIVTSGLQFNLQTAPTSGTTWTDSSGNGRNATLVGSPSYVSNNGGGIKLNNEDVNGTDYISVPYNINSNTVTVEVISSFNPTSFWGVIWGNEIYNTSEGYLAYVNSSTEISYGIPNSETTVTITESNAIRHWIFVINGTQASLFLNGSQVGTTVTINNQTLFATGGFQFGSRFAANDGTGSGDTMNNSNSALYPVFYQMRVYNRALSGAEVTQNYNAIKGTYGI